MRMLALSELARRIHGRVIDRRTIAGDGAADFLLDPQVGLISIDSRTLEAGALFWALRGERFDGHSFVAAALAEGAVGCVVEQEPVDRSGAVIAGLWVLVPDTLQALGQLANSLRRDWDGLLVGITGSVGKTTTRELVYAALSTEHAGMRSPASFNNQVGVPLTLLNLVDQHEFAAVELGASRVGEIRELCAIAEPEVGIVTAIGKAHLESFGSVEGIWQGKGELIDAVPPNGFGILPGDDPLTRSLAARCRGGVILVGTGSENDVIARDVQVDADGLAFTVSSERFMLPGAGRHQLTNSLCAIALGLEIGIPLEKLADGLAEFQPVAGRSDVRSMGPWRVIDDTYNASPTSMAAGLNWLQDLRRADRVATVGGVAVPAAMRRAIGSSGAPRAIAVLGEMAELGFASEVEHRTLGQLAAASGVDFLVAFGPSAGAVVRGAREQGMSPYSLAGTQDLDTLLAILDCWLQPGDWLYVKGSRVMRMERVLAWLAERAETAIGPRGIAI